MHRILIAGAASALAVAAGAFAQLPEPLEQALSAEVIERDPQVVEFRVGANDARITVRMTEVVDGPSEYVLLSPPEETLNEAQAELWADLQDEDEGEDETDADTAEDESDQGFASEDYDPESIRRMIGEDVRFDREENGVQIYSFQPQTMPDEDPEAERDPAAERMLENLAGEVHLDAQTGSISSVRLNLTEGFKPNFAARIKEFSMIRNFVYDEAINGPRLSNMSFSIAGSAAFQSFNESMTIDILSIDWADAAPSGSDLGAAQESP